MMLSLGDDDDDDDDGGGAWFFFLRARVCVRGGSVVSFSRPSPTRHPPKHTHTHTTLQKKPHTHTPNNTGGNRKHWENHTRKTLNQLLVEMDGFESNEGVIVMAATNLPETLDAALKRPGRFDRMVAVPLPDVRGRKQILEYYIQGKPVAPDVQPAALARQTGGMSGDCGVVCAPERRRAAVPRRCSCFFSPRLPLLRCASVSKTHSTHTPKTHTHTHPTHTHKHTRTTTTTNKAPTWPT